MSKVNSNSKKKEDAVFKCPYKGCDKDYKTGWRLKSHIIIKHDRNSRIIFLIIGNSPRQFGEKKAVWNRIKLSDEMILPNSFRFSFFQLTDYMFLFFIILL